jgi:uncharacterized repeat protein (TIGR03803 family)
VKEVAMPSNKSLIVPVAALLIIYGILFAPTPASAADQEKVLYSFKGGKDGVSPSVTLIFDAAGNLYGATGEGGDYQCDRFFGCGTVFRLEQIAQGKWKKTTIHTFKGPEGAYPGGLILDAAGNLYGTTAAGGSKSYSGTVFELSPSGHGVWTETVLHAFHNKDGVSPAGSLIFDAAGNLYGTTQLGGAYNSGVVFKLAPDANGGWTETVLHSFNGKDGNLPDSALIFDALGNLYGTTAGGLYGAVSHGNWNCSSAACGNVFKLAPGTDGKWTETVLHSFNGKDGVEPAASLVLDKAGNLYGTTVFGGDLKLTECGGYGCGTVFKVAPGTNGKWTETVLHKFNGFVDGSYPYAEMIFDATGNLYGTTWYSGGMVFKLAPSADGKWKETIIRRFNGDDGANPVAGLVFDKSGNLYGTTQFGGKHDICQDQFGNGCGVVFEITP